MTALYAAGDLANKPLVTVLLDAFRSRVSGVLSLQQGAGAARVFVRDGEPAGAQVFVGFKPLGQYLLARGLIDIGSLDLSLAEMARTGRPQGEILIGMGAVTREVLESVLALQQADYLRQLAALDRGVWCFDPNAPLPEWTRNIRISAPRAILEVMAGLGATPFVSDIIGRFSGMTLTLLPAFDGMARRFAFSPEETELVARLRAPITCEALLSSPPMPAERASAVVATLISLGLVGAVIEDAAGLSSVVPAATRLKGATALPAQGQPPADAEEPDFDLTIVEAPIEDDPAVLVAEGLSNMLESWLQLRDVKDLERRMAEVGELAKRISS